MTKICRCGSVALDRKINIERNIAGRHIVFKNVPVLVCPNCNEQYLAAKILKQMDRLISKENAAYEVDFETDPKEQCLIRAFENLRKRTVFSPWATSDMPISLSELYIITGKLEELRRENVHVH